MTSVQKSCGNLFATTARRTNTSQSVVGHSDVRASAKPNTLMNGAIVKPARPHQRARTTSSLVMTSAETQKMVWGLQYANFGGPEMREIERAAPPIVQIEPNLGGSKLSKSISECQAQVWGLEYA